MPTPTAYLSSVGPHSAKSHGALDFFDARLRAAGQVGQRPRHGKGDEIAEVRGHTAIRVYSVFTANDHASLFADRCAQLGANVTPAGTMTAQGDRVSSPSTRPPPPPMAGWYTDPSGSGRQRYFNGTEWTSNYRQSPAKPAASTSGGFQIALLLVILALFGGCAAIFFHGTYKDSKGISPQDYVNAHAKDAHTVVVSVQEVQAGAAILADSTPDPGTEASFQQLLSDAKNSFESVKTSLATTTKPTGLDSAELEMFGAVDDLSLAVSSARSYVDSGKPSDLADYGTHRKQGRASWNEAVTKIWNAAGQTPPMVDAS
jgi:hypothetical protein